MNVADSVEIQTVQKFSRFARGACTVLIVILGCSILWAFVSVLTGPGSSHLKIYLGAYQISGDRIAAVSLKAWLSVLFVAGSFILFSVLHHMRSLFDNLSRGDIYTHVNVRHIRSIGFLVLWGAILQFAVPILSAVLVKLQIIDLELLAPQTNFTFGLQTLLAPFATAGLIILMAWIMEVGRGVSDEVVTLRHDAELVV
jgi:hypothetical protein